ncbi:citrate synthase, putative [Trypanosoma cruzi]|uniref:Citrate synthase n=2 Tax=Trypanosoma cruzi TaxID=5693 RepID=V5BWC7_TRYCR|nr:citrate synthase, putative [Trypanosoma cruzi]ESS68863.1 citrate synthase [Trypanosoma cruzi Dm28c]KAF8282195.1 putative citrate synthase [Trypanosoma cruzi]PBJ70324.1 citrate synthase [Trypanosoma cruzi cruzi]PWV01576.1 putative citrate synthase [Trypanosoma cruzi]
MMRFCARAGILLNAPSAARRHLTIVDELKAAVMARHEADAPKMKILKEKYKNEKLSDATIDAAYGGMRGITGLIYESSMLDKEQGICFRGMTIPECCEKIPKSWKGGTSPLPEGMLWLLMTGSIPTDKQVKELHVELHRRADNEAITAATKTISSLPENTHPMTQLSTGVLALQAFSKFAPAYASGKAIKSNFWEYALEDSLDIIARTPYLAAAIYNRLTTGRAAVLNPANPDLDWAANFTNMLGYQDEKFWDCMRLYLSLHADHEGGNVSAHATTLVASALSDPYLSFSAGLNGLAGPLHGLANQESLSYLFEMRDKCKAAGVNMKDRKELAASLEKLTWERLNAKRVIPGYGHAVLRIPDPRYICLREYCLKHFPDDELFFLVDTIYSIMPDILKKHGKTKNPFPNVDAHSGMLLQHFGLTEQNFYTVLFGISRQLGALTGVVWDRLQGRPIERPKSITSDALFKKFKIE